MSGLLGFFGKRRKNNSRTRGARSVKRRLGFDRLSRLGVESLEDRRLLAINPFAWDLPPSCPEPYPEAPIIGLDRPIVKDDLVVSQSLRQVQIAIEERLSSGGGQLDRLSTDEIYVDRDGRVEVDVRVDVFDDRSIALLEAAGMDVKGTDEFMRIVEGWVSHTAIDSLAAVPGVSRIASPIRPVTDIGDVDSAGEGILKANDVHASFAALGVDGSGITVGVISDGVNHLAASQSTLDLPPSVTIDPDRSGSGDEGTALLEIVHDLAPGADLCFSAPSSSVEMVASINWLVAQGCDVILDDASSFEQPMFQYGPIAEAVANAVASGVVYVSSAGNYADRHYQGQYDPFGGGTHHDFGDDDMLIVTARRGTIRGRLQWSDPFGQSGNDYDLYLLGQTGEGWTTIASSVNRQDGNDYPYESIDFDNSAGTYSEVAWVIDRFTGAARELELYSYGSIDSSPNESDYVAGDSIFGHKALESVISVGAINADDDGHDTVASYSSHGPSTIYTDFGTQTSVQLQTLDGCGIDGVQTKVGQNGFFSNPFYGTSAAAPHVAAIAALLLDVDGSLTPAQVSSALCATAVDLTAYGTGYDTASGYGRFDALAAAYKVFTPSAPDLGASSDSGRYSDDDVTNDTTPTFSGTAPAGSYVRLYVDGVEQSAEQLGSAATNYSITTPALSNGWHAVTIRVSENSSTPTANLSNISSALYVEIDTAAPSAPTAPDLQATSDSGFSASDNITSDNTPTFGLSGASPYFRFYWNGTRISGEYESGTSYTTAAQADGSWSYTVRAVDTAGNESTDGTAIAVTVDTAAPVAPSAPDLQATSDSGFSTSDNNTSDSTPTFGVSGSSPYFRFYRNGARISGEYEPGTTYTTATQADGSWNYSLRAVDAAGNVSGDSTALTVTVDTAAPAVPSAPDLQSTSDSGISTTDNITGDNTPTFDVSGVGLYFRFYRNAARISGEYESGASYTAAVQADGSWTYSVRAVDLAGNESADGTVLSVTVDTAAPAAPSAPDLQTASDTGASSTDNITGDNTPTFDLTGASPYFRFYRDTTRLSGDYEAGASYTAAGQSDGAWSYTVRAVDAAGNESAASAAVVVTVDTTAPAAPLIQLVAPDTGASASDGVTYATNLVVAGSAEVYGHLTLRDNGDFVETVAVNSGGFWLVEASFPQQGLHALTATVSDAAGNTSAPSASRNVTIDTSAPLAPTGLDLAAEDDTGVSSTDNVTSSTGALTISGGGESGAAVELFDDMNGNGVVDAGESLAVGNVSSGTFTHDISLASGTHSVKAIQTDLAGNRSVATAALQIIVDVTASTLANVSSSTVNGWYSAGQFIDVAVQFSEVVLASGQPRLLLETGSTDRYAAYQGGSGTNVLTFRYTVQVGDSSNDLDYVGTDSLVLNGGAIHDPAGNLAVLTLPEPGMAGSLGDSKDLVIDTIASDASGNGLNGTLVNGPTWSEEEGRFNGAITFNGANSYVSVADTDAHPLQYTGGEMTLSAWVYINPSETTGGVLISKPWNNNGDYNYFLQLSGDNRVGFLLGGATTYRIWTDDSLSTETWHHIVATVDNSQTMTIYVDGVNVQSASHTIVNWTPANGDKNKSLVIGTLYGYGPGSWNYPTHAFDGKMDDVRIYGRALSGTEIASSMAWETSTYDAAGNLWQVTDPEGLITEYSYDTAGNLWKVTDPAGNVTQYAYDAEGREIGQTEYDPNELISYWTLNDLTGALASDSSGNGLNGTLVNGPTWLDEEGRFNGAMAFNGTNSYVSVADTGNRPLRFTGGELTLSTWVYINPSESTDGVLISKPWNGSGDYNYYLYINAAKQVVLQLGGATTSRITTDGSLSVGTWHHLVATVDSTDVMTIYVDGVNVKSASHTITNWTPVNGDLSRPLAIGTYYPYGEGSWNYPNHAFDGKMDDVRIYGRALSGTEIASSMAWQTSTYDAAGNLWKVTDPQGLITEYNYDAAGNLWKVTDPQGQVTQYAYDRWGRRIGQTQQYDPANLLGFWTLND